MFTWQPGWNQPGLRFLVCSQEASWNQVQRSQQAVFFPPVQFFEKGSCKVHDESFQPGLNCLHAFFSFFQPGYAHKSNRAFTWQPGLRKQSRVYMTTRVEKAIARLHDNPGWDFNPGCHVNARLLLCAYPGWNSSCKHSLSVTNSNTTL